jgi:hypothetical protein
MPVPSRPSVRLRGAPRPLALRRRSPRSPAPFGLLAALGAALGAACSPTTNAGAPATPAVVAAGSASPPPAVPAPAPPAAAPVQGQLDAYNAHDLERFVSFYDPEVVVTDLGSGRVLARGLVAMRDLYGKLFVKVPTLRATLVTRTGLGPWVVDHERLAIEGDPRAEEAIAVYEVQAGTIHRVWLLAPARPPAKQP